MSKGSSANKSRKHRHVNASEEDFSLSATLQFLQRVSGDARLSAAFRRFSAACDELEQAGLHLEDAVMAKLAIDEGLAGCSFLEDAEQPMPFPWETSRPVPGRSI